MTNLGLNEMFVYKEELDRETWACVYWDPSGKAYDVVGIMVTEFLSVTWSPLHRAQIFY